MQGFRTRHAPKRELIAQHGERQALALSIAVALFPTILAIWYMVDDPTAAVAFLYAVPIAIVATARGVRAGLVAASAATLLLMVAALPSPYSIGVFGWFTRLLLLFGTAYLVGTLSGRLEHLNRGIEAHPPDSD